jgi:hypothetical protein
MALGHVFNIINGAKVTAGTGGFPAAETPADPAYTYTTATNSLTATYEQGYSQTWNSNNGSLSPNNAVPANWYGNNSTIYKAYFHYGLYYVSQQDDAFHLSIKESTATSAQGNSGWAYASFVDPLGDAPTYILSRGTSTYTSSVSGSYTYHQWIKSHSISSPRTARNPFASDGLQGSTRNPVMTVYGTNA